MGKTSVCNNLRQIVSVCGVTALLFATATQLESQTVLNSRDYAAPSTQGTAQSSVYSGVCSAAYKPGNYGFIGLGEELASNPFGEPAGPIASLLVVSSNGDGTLTVQRTDFANGVLIAIPTVPGTYVVGDDCTVKDTIPLPNGGALRALTGYGVIVQDGAEVDYTATTPGVVIQNYVGRKMPEQCTNGTLEGAYGFSGNGTMLPTSSWGSSAGPLTTIGTLYFDGTGSFRKENEQAFINGGLFPIDTSTGNYSVSADCRLTITATSTDDFTAIGLVVDGGESVDVMPTMPGVVVETIVAKKITKTQ